MTNVDTKVTLAMRKYVAEEKLGIITCKARGANFNPFKDFLSGETNGVEYF